ncbi:MAG: CidA/LrgA family protein [Lachnospiraceae bacterium]|nr:CidA/LrgA family protein [Lachnospiraceae bacterium]
MKYIKQLGVILTVSFLGELLHFVLPLPVPASVYGLALMLAGLKTGIIRLSMVKATGSFLVEMMPLMFVPAGVGLMTSWEELWPVLLPVLLTVVVTTALVLAVTGRMAQLVIRKERHMGKERSKELCRNS